MSTDDPPTPPHATHGSNPNIYDELKDNEVPPDEAARRASLRPPQQDQGAAALFEAPDPAAVSGAHPRLAEGDFDKPTDHEVAPPRITADEDSDAVSDADVVFIEEEKPDEAPTGPHSAAAPTPVNRSLPPPPPAQRPAQATTEGQSDFWAAALKAPAPGVPPQIPSVRPTTPGQAATPPVVAASPVQISSAAGPATGPEDDFNVPPLAPPHEVEPLGMAPLPTDAPTVAAEPHPDALRRPSLEKVVWKADPDRTTDPPPAPSEPPSNAWRLGGIFAMGVVFVSLGWIGVQVLMPPGNPPVTQVARPQPPAPPVAPPTVVYRPAVPPAPFPAPPPVRPVAPAPSTPTPQAAPPPCRRYGSFIGANGAIDPALPQQLGYIHSRMFPGQQYGPDTWICRD